MEHRVDVIYDSVARTLQREGRQSMVPLITRNVASEGKVNVLTPDFTDLKFALIVLTEFNNFHLR